MVHNNSGISGLSSSFIQTSGGKAPIGGPVPVTFSAEVIGVLKKLDIIRLERNNKRSERRKAGEANVSEDEDDEISPYFLGNSTGANSVPPAGLGAVPNAPGPAPGPAVPDPVVPGPEADPVVANPKLLFTDKNAATNSFRANDNTIPNAIFSLAKNGISPPLTLFLPASLARIRSSNVKTVKHGTGESTKVTVIDVSDFPDETTMEQAVWNSTYNTFLSFMDLAAEAHIVQGFSRHYDHILSDVAVETWFPAYRNFDRTIRAQFFTTPYIIDIHSSDYRTALQAAKDAYIWSNLPSHTPSGPRASGGSGGRERVDRHKPYDRENRPQSDGGQRRKPVLCFRCGRTGHPAGRCPEKTPSKHGREFVIYANSDGLFRISDQRAVCMLFNCGRCESTPGSRHPIHVCTLCGDAHHGAIDCTRN
ncbi:hypothetical protein GGX14DRAFT_365198 [Mycena pura]|uniref:CCHC-type domain-containing protein n=1 Tax=Mycena pura TaxID=153505 RepID=A0AAD6VFX5_9AGAR|nr:hypothetical protein GGX14DRAFT_365192 [Mycena pura]KAJ7208597.1 hypothetical protein GGX14DRAFT_365198 [Mycena pura]